MLSQEFIDEMKARLLSERDRLTADLTGLAEHTEIGADYDENATEIQIDEVNQDVRSRMQDDLEKIDKALAKIENGSYGTDDSGVEIPEERLRVIPWADQSV